MTTPTVSKLSTLATLQPFCCCVIAVLAARATGLIAPIIALVARLGLVFEETG